MKSKILMVGWGYPPEIDGGLDVHVARLFQELRDLNIEADLILPEENAPEMGGIIPAELPGEGIMEKSRDLSQKVARASKEYDTVHTHDWFGAESGLKARKYSGASWITTFHSIASGRSRNPLPDVEKLERAMIERSDKTIAVSGKLAEEVRDKYGKKPGVVRNGFSKPEFQGNNIKKHLGINGEMIFYVGRHAEQKGLEHLIYGFSKLLENREATLVLGGDGHMKDALEEFSEMLGIENDVIFQGFIPQEELGDYYRSADVFVSPSINEPFGLTITEAFTAGTPVVATESGAEELLPDKAVISAEPDSDSLRKSIEEALERKIPETDERSWKEVAEETVDIYREI